MPKPFEVVDITCQKCGWCLYHRPGGGFLCKTRSCPDYEFADARRALGRPRSVSVREVRRAATPLSGLTITDPAASRKRRALKPGQVRVRYNDGSQYTINAVYRVGALKAGGYFVEQDPPLRATKRAPIMHYIPAHNVDVIVHRPHGQTPLDLAPPHSHEPIELNWFQRAMVRLGLMKVVDGHDHGFPT